MFELPPSLKFLHPSVMMDGLYKVGYRFTERPS